MASIHQLSAKTSHSLSIGQVVTSVFSVVKELVENALDAGASSVDIRLDDYGLEKIEVRDNGSGLAPEDTAVMAQAHYTSKIQDLNDMGSLGSFGFRGEALSAVCACCQVTVATRTAAEQAGRLVTLDASGAITAQRPVARAQGTTVTASSLFSRQPVRRQLYGSARKRKEDLRAVEALLSAIAVSRPALRLALHHNGCQLINKAPCDSNRSAALQVLKSEAARQLRPLSLKDKTISVEALLPSPDTSPKIAGRSTGDQCFVIVNGRVVTFKKVEKLLREQFSSFHGLSPARTPVSVVLITVPPDQLDVNLEPNKTRLLLLCEPSRPVTEGDGVPELGDIEWEGSSESLFGDNFLGVDGGDGDTGPLPADGDGGSSSEESFGPKRYVGARPDAWATGRLLDSQGDVIEPTKLITAHGEPATKRPKIQPSIREAFSSVDRPLPTANGLANPTSAATVGGTNGRTGPDATPAAGGGGADKPAAPASKPPPAKRPRPAAPGEPEYEPVASQVVRRAGTAFHYYCKDMRRKYLSLDPTIDIGKLSAALADGWKAALPSVRRQFEDMAREDEKRYKEDVRKAKLAEMICTPQRTITDFCRVDTALRRMVAPLTPEARASRPRRHSKTMSVRGMEEQIRRLEAGKRPDGWAAAGDPRVIGPVESHHAWVVYRSSQLVLVNPLRLSEMATLSRLLSTFHFPCRPLSPPLPLTSAALGAAAHSTLCALPRDGSRVSDVRLEANGFGVEVAGDSARLVAVTDCMEFYGAPDLAEVLRKVADGAETVEDSRPARAVSWLRAEAVRISQGGGARMSREEVDSLVHDTPDLDGNCFHGRPLGAPLYDLVT
ncbi:PMS1 1 [Amphibalanus amphitrite]|uniref:PMS1 1 n=2 Tax=Amphibalanus amphitrite TaxID=1232801 RepID=A0A6A4VKT3_AMPAM|nr:PMS1 1 [Amphibalanus amphitrite]